MRRRRRAPARLEREPTGRVGVDVAERDAQKEEGGGGADDAADGRGDDEAGKAPPFGSSRRRDGVVRARHRHRVRQHRQRHRRRHGRTIRRRSSVEPGEPADGGDRGGGAVKREDVRARRDAVRDVVSYLREDDATGDDGVREDGESRDAERDVRVRANRVSGAVGGDGDFRRRQRRRVRRARAHRADRPPTLAKRRHESTRILRRRLRQRVDAIERGIVRGRERPRDVHARARKAREATRLARRRRRRARRHHHANAELARARHASRRVPPRRVAERYQT